VIPSLANIREALPHLLPKERAELIAYVARFQPPPQFVDGSFAEQAAFIEDPARLKAVLCNRRAGKSYGVGLYLFKTAYENPGVSVLYVGLTRQTCKRIMWKDVLKVIDRKLGLRCKFNETELHITLPNGSVIYLLGLDADERERDKALGQKYPLVVIDEVQSFSVDLEDLVYRVLKPTVMDYRGVICLTGTPGNLKRGLYYELTKDAQAAVKTQYERRGWSVRSWSATDNPVQRTQWHAEVAELRGANENIDEVPWFQQDYLGRWVVDDTKLVYRFDAARNTFDGELPKYAKGEWHYVLGCDLGYSDDTALTLWAYHDHGPSSYALKSEKAPGLDVTAVAEWAKSFAKGYRIDHWMIDGANKQAIEEMRRRHGIPWTAADKTGKEDFIEIMNAELILGRVKLDRTRCAALADEYGGLIWKDHASGLAAHAIKRQEHPGCPNHCADSALYAWRKLYAFRSKAPATQPKPGTEEWLRAEEERLFETERRRAEERQQQARGDLSPWAPTEEMWG
jgi:hypothetical protein